MGHGEPPDLLTGASGLLQGRTLCAAARAAALVVLDHPAGVTAPLGFFGRGADTDIEEPRHPHRMLANPARVDMDLSAAR